VVWNRSIGQVFNHNDCEPFLLFDYGDHWLFKVTKSRKKAQDPIQGIEYPRLIEEVGKKPEQYPSWEE
jgi:hypothetical protein